MKRKLIVSWIAGSVVAWLACGPAYGWILAQDQEQVQAADQAGLELILQGHVVAVGGGKTTGTNPFSSPNRISFVATGGGSPTTGITKTGLRFFGFGGVAPTIPNSPGIKRHVGVFSDGPNVPALLDKYWTPDGSQANSPTARSPGVSVAYQQLGGGDVRVTISNALSADAIQLSQVGYRVLTINSFTVENLNRTHMPPESFVASGVADGTVLAASGGSTSFTVSGVTLEDDIVVYATAVFNALGGPSSGTWVAWNSGTYLPARKPFLGRVPIRAVPPVILVGETLAAADVALRTPFQVVTQVVGGAPARFLSIRRIDYDPGRCVPQGDDPAPGVGCNGAFGNAVLINANLNDLVLDTTGPGGTKISYLRTAGISVYTDVRVQARIMPGASTMTTTVAGSDDFGGPVAIRIGPTGGSYFASVVTGRRNQIDLMRDSVNGATQTSLATATQWANGDPIVLDHNVPDPPPDPDTPAPYTPTVYDVVLQAVGSSLALTVSEVGNPLHTLTLGPVSDTTYTQGYVGLRTQRDGSALSGSEDAFIATMVETVVRDYKIEDPTATPTMKAAMIMEYDTTPGDPGERGGTLGSSRVIEVLNDHAIAELLIEAGFEVDEIKMGYELDYWTRDGEFIINPDATSFHPTPLNDYDLIWYSGTGADQSRNSIGVYLTKPLIMGEHVSASGRNCLATPAGIVPGQPGDTCPAGQSDSRMGMWDAGSGDFRPDANQTGPHASALRLLPSVGDPHPIIASLTDGSGTQEIPVYADPWPHMPCGGTNFGTGVEALAVERVAGGPDGDVNGHAAWGLVVADPGDGRQILGGDGLPNTAFVARSAFVFLGDHVAHRLTPQGRELARRTALWAAGVPIPASPFLYYGDFDEDGDVDAVDYGHMLACVDGANPVSFEGLCADADSDGDGDADSADMDAFTVCFNGSGNVPPLECVTPRISIRGEPPEGVPSIPFDFDDDADVDADDLAVFAACAAGPEVARGGGADCEESDADNDGDVDSTDFGPFQGCYSGTDNPSSPDCDD